MKKGTSSELRVGVFVVIALGLLMAAVLVLSARTSVFRRAYRLHTNFSNVAGLTGGADVRLAGVSVGYIGDLRFPADPAKAGVRVDFTVNSKAMERLTKDSHATIATMGLLGAKYIELVPGDPASGRVKQDDAIQGVDPMDYMKELERAGTIVHDVGALSQAIQRLVESLNGQGPPTDVSQAVTSLKNIIASVETGPGLAHELLVSGKREAIADDLAAAIHDLKEMVAEVRGGRGTLHALLYDPKGEQIVDNLRRATDAIQSVLAEVRDGNGVLHGVIYGGKKGEDIAADLETTAANLRAITDVIRSGQGTLGGLIVDPTIYEDALKITGEVKRSNLLKAVIRYVIKHREASAAR